MSKGKTYNKSRSKQISMSCQSNKKGQIKEILWKKIERHNDNDPKFLKPWNTFWAYTSLFFIAKSHILLYIPLKVFYDQTSKQPEPTNNAFKI